MNELMKGIYILSRNEAFIESDLEYRLLFCISIGCTFIAIAIFTAVCESYRYEFCVSIGIIGLAAVLLSVLMLILIPQTNIAYVEYKVMITDEADMTEFLKQYEVISKNGDIYKIRQHVDKCNTSQISTDEVIIQTPSVTIENTNEIINTPEEISTDTLKTIEEEIITIDTPETINEEEVPEQYQVTDENGKTYILIEIE